MILYNVTININHGREKEWLGWMVNQHIPEVMKTGMFSSFNIYRLLVEDQSGGTNYSIQYAAESLAHVEKYLQEYAPVLMSVHNTKFRDEHAAYRTVMEKVA